MNLNLYTDRAELKCTCGSKDFRNKGYYYTATGKYSRYRCNECGSEIRGRINLFSAEKKKSLKTGTNR